ncbi:MAG: nitroreductase family deazaflavin-dependent oxidoreductase [Acidimicrobiales bacterium]
MRCGISTPNGAATFRSTPPRTPPSSTAPSASDHQRGAGRHHERLQPDDHRRVPGQRRARAGQFEGATLLLLHTTGARSGQPRISPLAYQSLGDGVAVFASKAGAPDNPDWFHNIVAHPDVEAEIGSETIAFRARIAEGAERERIWEQQKAAIPQFADYEAATDRVIPVIVLDRR